MRRNEVNRERRVRAQNQELNYKPKERKLLQRTPKFFAEDFYKSFKGCLSLRVYLAITIKCELISPPSVQS